ncbi:hypothetical protein Tco_1578475 [Tanacetum coccineum]
MKDDLKYVTSLEDEFDETCLILDIQQYFFKTQFESVKLESHSHMYENKIFKQNSSLENKNYCLKTTITELSNQASDVKEEMTYTNDTMPRMRKEIYLSSAKLEAHCIYLELKSQNKSSTSVQNGHVLSNKSDEAKIKFDTEDLENINIELEHSIESVKKKKFDSRILNDFLQKSLYDSDPSSVESESGEKNILFRNETSSFETKIKEFEMTLAQQTKDFEDAKIHDSKAEKEQFLKQIASLESNLASQNLISNKKEYNELRISYNALKAKFDVLNREKGKSPMLNFSTQKVSVSQKIYTGESSKSFPKKVSRFTTYSFQNDRKSSKKPSVFETPTPQKVFKSSHSSRKKQVFEALNSRFTPVKQV